MRCDLHVHSTASGMCDTPGLSRICKESYNDPAEVYHRCKRLGMSIVTLTDHDSIDAAEVLRKHADFFLSEEVTVSLPTGTTMHLGVYGITERDHAEIQRRRNDFIALLMYLTERRIFFSANHLFSSLTGRRDVETGERTGATDGNQTRQSRCGGQRLAHACRCRADLHGSSRRSHCRRILHRAAQRPRRYSRPGRQLRENHT